MMVEERDNDNDMGERLEDLEDLYKQATCRVFHGHTVSIVSARIVLINMAVIHIVSNAFMDELLKYLSIVLLPPRNMLPKNHYEAKKLIQKFGINYDIIHACLAGCILYCGEYKDLTSCPKKIVGNQDTSLDLTKLELESSGIFH